MNRSFNSPTTPVPGELSPTICETSLRPAPSASKSCRLVNCLDVAHTVTLEVQLSGRLAKRVRELAAREHISVDALVFTALNAQIDHSPHRPTIAERAARVDWEKVDAILARVPDVPPMQGDEK
ncbi:MAG: hypothetical protein ACR2OZ_19430 [Verrucomicrobiales bacterium]